MQKDFNKDVTTATLRTPHMNSENHSKVSSDDSSDSKQSPLSSDISRTSVLAANDGFQQNEKVLVDVEVNYSFGINRWLQQLPEEEPCTPISTSR